jgi:multiple sugar transport system permease protein
MLYRSPRFRQKERWFYFLISPWILGFFLFFAGPITAAFLISFTDWNAPQVINFVGLKNFEYLIKDALFAKTLNNTIKYALGSVPIGIILGLILAVALTPKRKGVIFFRTIFFLPVVISGVATTLLWGMIFNPRYGLLNAILSLIGIRGPAWLSDEKWAMPAIILMSIWGVGVNMLIHLAALQNIPPELQDAAALDGAGAWHRFQYITLPLITPVTFYLIVVNIIAAFQVFTPTYLLTRGGPNNATLTMPLYIYLNAFAWNKLGYATTLSLFLFLMVLLLTILQFRLGDRWVFHIGSEV